MAAIEMVLPVQARCTGCGGTFEAGYEIPLDFSGGRLTGRRLAKRIAAATRRAAQEEGWAVSRSEAYCPCCAEKVALGAMPPKPFARPTAIGYLDGLLLARSLRKSKGRRGEDD